MDTIVASCPNCGGLMFETQDALNLRKFLVCNTCDFEETVDDTPAI